jgi:hypothetical protein
MLGIYGPLNPYKTWTRLLKDETATQPTIRADLEELFKEGLVRNVDTDRKARGGRPSKHYELSLPGLMTVIGNLKDNKSGHRFLNDLAKKYRGLMPSVFDVWPAILEGAIGDVAFRRLQEICISELEAGLVSKDSCDLEPNKVHENFFAPETYLEETHDDHVRWFRGIMRDRTLRECMRASLHHQIDYYEYCQKMFMTGIRNAEKIMKAISEKDAQN